MTSVEAPLNNDLKPIKKLAMTDLKSGADANSMRYSNGYDIEKSISHNASLINASQAPVSLQVYNLM
jgi:hypothetical protein